MIMSFLPARSNIVIRVYFHILSAYSHVLSGSSTPKKHQKAPPREKKPFSNFPLEPSSFRCMQNIVCGPSFFMLRQFSAHHPNLFLLVGWPFFVRSIFLSPCQLPHGLFFNILWSSDVSCPRVRSCLATNRDLIFGNYTMPLYRLSILPRRRQKSSETTTGRTDGHKFSQNSIVC